MLQIAPYYPFYGGDGGGSIDSSDSNRGGDNVDCDSDYDEEGNNGNDDGQ